MSFKPKAKEMQIVKSVRLPKTICDYLEQLAAKYNISFNEVVTQCITYACENINEFDK